MNMIDKEHIENMRKRQETIEKVYKEKVHYLDEVNTKDDAFMEGINAAIQVLNLHLVSESDIIHKCSRCEFDKKLGFCPKCDTDCYSH